METDSSAIDCAIGNHVYMNEQAAQSELFAIMRI